MIPADMVTERRQKRMRRLSQHWNLSPLQHAVDSINPAELAASADDLLLIEQLRSGNEAAFVSLVEHYHSVMLRLALVYVTERTVAEEVTQQTWRVVLEDLDQFEGHSSLKIWLFRELINCATMRAQREGRRLPFSSLPDDSALTEPTVDAARFWPADHRWAGHWVAFPSDWEDLSEDGLLSQQTRAYLDQAIEALPPSQRAIILLRDIEGWTSDETYHLLGISEATQRILLHHARSQVRGALEKHFVI
jgi:RNA polymerase sigma-70 factor, ECF subfamily